MTIATIATSISLFSHSFVFATSIMAIGLIMTSYKVCKCLDSLSSEGK